MRVSKLILFTFFLIMFTACSFAAIKLRVVAVNPSADEEKTAQVNIPLPKEVGPADIIDQGNLELEFDEKESIYYVFKKDVKLKPKETKVFEIEIRDVWIIPDHELIGLKRRTERILKSLEKSDYYKEAVPIADSIYGKLDEINALQQDETISREKHIGIYRTNLGAIKKIREDIDKLEKLLIYIGGPPAPEMLEESSLKSDAPSKATTWFIIFIIMAFIALLGFVFFFTWHKQAQITDDVMLNARKSAFPEQKAEEDKKEKRS